MTTLYLISFFGIRVGKSDMEVRTIGNGTQGGLWLWSTSTDNSRLTTETEKDVETFSFPYTFIRLRGVPTRVDESLRVIH